MISQGQFYSLNCSSLSTPYFKHKNHQKKYQDNLISNKLSNNSSKNNNDGKSSKQLIKNQFSSSGFNSPFGQNQNSLKVVINPYSIINDQNLIPVQKQQISKSKENLKKDNLTQKYSIKEMYQIINYKKSTGVGQYKPPRFQSQEKKMINQIRNKAMSNFNQRNNTSFNFNSNGSLNKNERCGISKFQLLSLYIKNKQKRKKMLPGPGFYDPKIRSHTVSVDIKKQINRNSYLEIIDKNAKKYHPPSPNKYKIARDFQYLNRNRKFFQQNDKNNNSSSNQFRKRKSISEKLTYLDNVQALANQTPGVGNYIVNSKSMPKNGIIGSNNNSWFFKKEVKIQSSYKNAQDIQQFRKNERVFHPGPSYYNPNHQIKLFSNFPKKAYNNLVQNKPKLKIQRDFTNKKNKDKQNIGPGQYMGLCQWTTTNTQAPHFTQFNIISKGPIKSVYYN